MSILDAKLRVTMRDGSMWVIVKIIAENRAKYYAYEFDDDPQRSLDEDTLPLFESDDYEIEVWATNSMNWDDVRDQAVKVEDPRNVDYQEGWVNGETQIIR